MTPSRLHTPEDVIASRYRIVTLLGKGGMSETYEAEDLSTHQRIALKVLSLRQMTDWKMLDLFEREAKTLAQLSHPNIPHYIDSFHLDVDSGSEPFESKSSGVQGDRQFYLVRDLVAGESLADRLNKGWRPTEADLQDIAMQVLKILDYLHGLSPPLIHRDIKPPNIIRQTDGTLFLVDFGSVQAIYRETLLGSNTFVGTAGYMPPEQFRGQAIAPSDLYSVGATLLFLATQRTPDQLPQTRMKVNMADCTTFSSKFTAWLAKLLEPIPEDRFQTAAEALDALIPATNRWSELHGFVDNDALFNSSRTNDVSSLNDGMFVMPQPTGSRSTVERSSDRLRITIPLNAESTAFFQNLGQRLTGFLGFRWFGQPPRQPLSRVRRWTKLPIYRIVLGFMGVFIVASIGVSLLLFLLSLWPFWLIGIIIIWSNRDRNDTMVLDVTAQEFYLRHIRQGQDQKVYQGNSQILYASLGPEGSKSKSHHPRMACVLTEHTQRRYTMHYIGQHLMPSEQEWLVDEISLFLKSIKIREP